MKKSITAVCLLLFALATVLAIAQESLAKGNKSIWRESAQAAWRESQENRRPLLLFFTMDNCPHCHKMLTRTYRDAHVVEALEQSFTPTVVHADEYPELVRDLEVRSFPTTVIVSPDGRVLDSVVGYVSAKHFHRKLQALRATSRK